MIIERTYIHYYQIKKNIFFKTFPKSFGAYSLIYLPLQYTNTPSSNTCTHSQNQSPCLNPDYREHQPDHLQISILFLFPSRPVPPDVSSRQYLRNTRRDSQPGWSKRLENRKRTKARRATPRRDTVTRVDVAFSD